jgi:hypothetical protein
VIRAGGGECELRMPWRAEDMGQYGGFLHAGLIGALLERASDGRLHVVPGVVSVRCCLTSARRHRSTGGRVSVATATTLLVPTG